MKPTRVQLRRTKGWRMPENTLKVDRSTKWGNPFRVGRISCDGSHVASECDCQCYYGCKTTAEAVKKFREWRQEIADLHARNGSDFVRRWLRPLRGKNLGCWCKIGEPCHADVLLELANA